jgi:dihydrofolate synthase/folylpolyglutamate synthase
MKFGLENISRLCAALGHPERTFSSILVAGTNGKGSVTAMVHRALVAAGHHAGRYTSPHLERMEERYVVGDREVDSGQLGAVAEIVRGAIAGLLHRGELQAPPTFFESATALAFELFRRAGVSIAVLEVGLGGRLDATNVVTPMACAITSIDFDHEAQLGHTIESIAVEKAGIIRPAIPVVCGALPPVAETVVRSICQDRAARFVPAGDFSELSMRHQLGAPHLRGGHQRANAAVAVRLLLELNTLGLALDDRAIRAGVSDVVWPGRLELFRLDDSDVLLDAAHNPAGARALSRYLREAGWSGDCALVFGAMQDKNVREMLAALAPVCAEVICTTPHTPRALPADALAAAATAVPGAGWRVSIVSDPAEALAAAAGRSRRVVAAGSIFLIGPLRGILRTR